MANMAPTVLLLPCLPFLCPAKLQTTFRKLVASTHLFGHLLLLRLTIKIQLSNYCSPAIKSPLLVTPTDIIKTNQFTPTWGFPLYLL